MPYSFKAKATSRGWPILSIVVAANLLVFAVNILTAIHLDEESQQESEFLSLPATLAAGVRDSESKLSFHENVSHLIPTHDPPLAKAVPALSGGISIDDAGTRWPSPPSLASTTGRDERAIYFLHIYKSGGTSFCSTARGAKKRVPPGANCNLDRGMSDLPPRVQLERVRRYEVAANEYDGLPTLESLLVPPSEVAYVVMVRDPMDRLLSHFAAAQVFSRNNQGAFRDAGLLHVPSSKHCTFHDCSFVSFLHWLGARRANPALPPAKLSLPWTRGDFLLRYFVGFDACALGSCSAAHVAIAKERMRRLFTVVLVLEEVDSRGWASMRAAFGWPAGSAVRRSGTRRSSDARREVAGDEDAMVSLVEAVGPHDMEIYRYAKELSHAMQARQAIGGH